MLQRACTHDCAYCAYGACTYMVATVSVSMRSMYGSVYDNVYGSVYDCICDGVGGNACLFDIMCGGVGDNVCGSVHV
jgi:hypothetical protein